MTLAVPPLDWFDWMPAEPFEAATTRMMSTVALPGPLTASMPLPALKFAELSVRWH